MSMDSSLKTRGNTMGGKRSVMTRAERIATLKADKRMTDKNAKALNLPKTKVVEK